MRYLSTIVYVLLIITVNIGFSVMPIYRFFGAPFSFMDPVAGIIYLMRDFAQRELGHYIFFAMAIGSLASYCLCSRGVALASVSAFIIGELMDWLIFTFSKKSVSRRLILSSCISAPLDSVVFIAMLHYLSVISFVLMTFGKILGITVIWLFWKLKMPGRSDSSVCMSGNDCITDNKMSGV